MSEGIVIISGHRHRVRYERRVSGPFGVVWSATAITGPAKGSRVSAGSLEGCETLLRLAIKRVLEAA